MRTVRRPRLALGVVGALVILLGLAGCGSALSPGEVAAGGRPVGGGAAADPGSSQTSSTDASEASDSTAPAVGQPIDDDGAGLPGTVDPGAPAGATGDPGNPVGPADPGGAAGPAGPATDAAPAPGGSTPPSAQPGGEQASTGASAGASASAPAAPGSASNCAGLADTTGITASTITIGNVSDLSGPQPGLFEPALDGVDAYLAYFKATGGTICGRTLVVKSYDSKTDAGGDQAGMVAACQEVFATVGSASGFDSGGAAAAQSCGIPDLDALIVTHERHACTTCFGASSTNLSQFENAVPDEIKASYGGGQHAAMFYLDAGAAAESGQAIAAACTKRGLHYDLIQPIGVGDFNYAPYVQELKDKKIESVQFVGASSYFARLAQAMQQGGYTPKVFMLDFSAYDPSYVVPAGSAGDGTVVFTTFTPFEEASTSPEEQLYLSYLQQVHPGASPSYGGVFGWSAARLFVQQATALGGRLTRASLIASLKSVEDWTSNGLHSPQNVGTKDTGDCWRFIRLQDGKWSSIGGTKYRCDGVTSID